MQYLLLSFHIKIPWPEMLVLMMSALNFGCFNSNIITPGNSLITITDNTSFFPCVNKKGADQPTFLTSSFRNSFFSISIYYISILHHPSRGLCAGVRLCGAVFA